MIWDWVNLYHIFVPAYSASQILCFVLSCGIWVASMTNVDSIPYSRWCSHISMWMIILLDYRDCHANSFQPTCSFSSGSDHFNIREINSQFFAMVFASSVPSCLCFPTLPPSFFKDSDFLIMYPSYGCEVSPFFSINVLIWWFSGRCSGIFKVIILHSRILFRWIQFKLQVLILSPSPFQVLSYDGVSLNLSPLAILLFRSVEDISGDSCFHS